MTRRAGAHRGPKGHRCDGPQKTVLHMHAKRERPDPLTFSGLTDQAMVTTAIPVYPEFGMYRVADIGEHA
jgi:hypothetical protein